MRPACNMHAVHLSSSAVSHLSRARACTWLQTREKENNKLEMVTKRAEDSNLDENCQIQEQPSWKRVEMNPKLRSLARSNRIQRIFCSQHWKVSKHSEFCFGIKCGGRYPAFQSKVKTFSFEIPCIRAGSPRFSDYRL